MNFAIQSTFTHLINKLKEVHHSLWILVLNSSIAAVAISLYLNNILIPAIIASRYYGNYYLQAIDAGVFIFFLTTVYGLAFQALRQIVNRESYEGKEVFLFKLFNAIRRCSAIVILLVNLAPRSQRKNHTQTGSIVQIELMTRTK